MIRYITLRQAETTFFIDSLGFKRHLPNRIRLFVSLIDAPTGQINMDTHRFNKEKETGRAGLHAINYARHSFSAQAESKRTSTAKTRPIKRRLQKINVDKNSLLRLENGRQ